jgi:hypothetical protein
LSRTSWLPDVDAVRDARAAETENGKQVSLTGHSNGSVPASEAVREFGTTGIVELLVFTAFLLDVGEPQWSFSKGEINPMWGIHGDQIVLIEACEVDLQWSSCS